MVENFAIVIVVWISARGGSTGQCTYHIAVIIKDGRTGRAAFRHTFVGLGRHPPAYAPMRIGSTAGIGSGLKWRGVSRYFLHIAGRVVDANATRGGGIISAPTVINHIPRIVGAIIQLQQIKIGAAAHTSERPHGTTGTCM